MERATTVGENIRRIREHLGWSQGHLASAAGISERILREAEEGDPFSSVTLYNIAAVLRVDPDELRKRLDDATIKAIVRGVPPEHVPWLREDWPM